MGIDVLVPVLGRPWNVEPFIESLAVTHSPYRVFFICSPGDEEEIDACRATDAETWVVEWPSGRGDFAKKINWGFGRTQSEWVFQGADDIRFTDGWDVEALHCAKGRAVVGTNDLHNPSVRRGTHSTHVLFRRDYIERFGGTFDGSGTVFSENYDHQWVDNEFIETAKLRGQWVFCKRSLVEHFHPVWGNNEWDDTYRKAFRESGEDQALYARRMAQLKAGR